MYETTNPSVTTTVVGRGGASIPGPDSVRPIQLRTERALVAERVAAGMTNGGARGTKLLVVESVRGRALQALSTGAGAAELF